jgi:hypothetical protein
MRYTIQRPATIWLETVVEAEDINLAIELADKDFNSGDYVEMIQTWDIDFERYWIQNATGAVITRDEGKVIVNA